MKPPSPLLGFNNNVRHKGRVFHIQTEDSGVRHPHIITHLFADGGRILKTIKTSYAEYLDSANMAEVVRQMMQDQHKGMFMALRDGQFDQLLEELQSRGAAAKSSPGASSAAIPAAGLPPGKAAPELPVPAKVAPEPPVPAKAAPPAAAPAPARSPTIPPPMPAALRQVVKSPEPAARTPEAAAKPPEPPGKLTLDLPPPAGKRAIDPVPAPPVPAARPPSVAVPVVVPLAPPIAAAVLGARDSAPPEPPPPPRPASGESATSLGTAPTTRIRVPAPQARPVLAIDPAAIHRVAEPSTGPSGGTLASVVEATVEGGPNIDLDTLERAAAEAETPLFQQIHDLPPPPAAVLGARPPGTAGGYSSVSAPAPPPLSVPVPSAPPSTRGRYAPSRPSSIFSSARPQEGSSIFGEDLISEKSLDEVILSYLAEDLDGPGEKK